MEIKADSLAFSFLYSFLFPTLSCSQNVCKSIGFYLPKERSDISLYLPLSPNRSSFGFAQDDRRPSECPMVTQDVSKSIGFYLPLLPLSPNRRSFAFAQDDKSKTVRMTGDRQYVQCRSRGIKRKRPISISANGTEISICGKGIYFKCEA